MARIPQTYHHITLHSQHIHNQYIVNCPLTIDEMYRFTKRRLANFALRTPIQFKDTITDNPGCPDVISLNNYAHQLTTMNGSDIKSLTKDL